MQCNNCFWKIVAWSQKDKITNEKLPYMEYCSNPKKEAEKCDLVGVNVFDCSLFLHKKHALTPPKGLS